MRTRIRRECGSVQINEASMMRTLFRPGSRLRQSASSSRDSGAAAIHVVGGRRKRSQSRQKWTVDSRGMPCVQSYVSLTQSVQRAPVASVPSIAAPHRQQRILSASVSSAASCQGRTEGNAYVAALDCGFAMPMATGSSRSIDMVGKQRGVPVEEAGML